MPKVTQKTSDSIARSVLEDIQAGKLHMRPRVYFATLTGIIIATSVAAGVALAYLTSVLYYWVRIVTADTMAYGARAHLSDALGSFPWWLLLVSIGLSAAAVWLVRTYGRMYRHRTVTIVLVLIIGSLIIGSGLAVAGVGEPYANQHAPSMQQRGQHKNLQN